MEGKKILIKNNCSSSSFLKFKGLDTIQNELVHEFKENIEKVSNSSPCKKNYQSLKQNNIILPLEEFMQSQNKKHLTTKFSHKEVIKFLEEKDKAMQEIIINEENNEIENNNKPESINNDNEKYLKYKNENNADNQFDNKSSHILIFHGTFGKDEYQKIMEQNHHHHHHHRHHHHHHHQHHLENEVYEEKKEIEEKKDKKENL